MSELLNLPDLEAGVPASLVPQNGVLAGRVGKNKVLLAWVDGAVVGVSGVCTHYDGPLEDGLREADTIRCPWHHACFSLKTGEAIEAPALSPLQCWTVEQSEGRLFVTDKRPGAPAASFVPPEPIDRILIVGGGGAGFAAAQRLRQIGYSGAISLLTEEAIAPYDRPSLSKDILSGKASPDAPPLTDLDFYKDQNIELRLGVKVAKLDITGHNLSLQTGETLGYDRLLLATGSDPIRPDIPGFDRPGVFVLRTPADVAAILTKMQSAKVAGILGASFIGLEAAASLRRLGLTVHIIAPDALPLEAKLGPELGAFIKSLHEDNGVVFHLGRKVEGYDGAMLTLDDGTSIDVDLVLAGVGVKPRLELASDAGLAIDNGVFVDAMMRTSAADVFAAGDIANFPEMISGRRARVEHWVAAERQGQVAAANMLGLQTPFAEPPFFWTEQYGVGIGYVGHAEDWDHIEVEGDLEAEDAMLLYVKDGAILAVATVGRDMDALKAANAFRRGAQPT